MGRSPCEHGHDGRTTKEYEERFAAYGGLAIGIIGLLCFASTPALTLRACCFGCGSAAISRVHLVAIALKY